ncbi:MAG: damage-inducible protein DinB [Pseudopedobacter saltans]|uniref:Damage-inducible protein DinB n=1 Tax=Pseudopedobacter saltans TaxID=151895 RepID=A0A2W5FBN2_9SPHI|nr:MAG: damage-inducible protein DinB [Pseudopedobacter saltans]
MKNLIPILVDELTNEIATTRKFIHIIPTDKYSWKPHPKSMSLGQLAVHIAEIASWPAISLNTDFLDFAVKPYEPSLFKDNNDLLTILNKGELSSIQTLESSTEEHLDHKWELRYGDKILLSLTKYGMVRHSIDQMIHHRAQLGVFLRLLDIPIPGSYGPSADDNNEFS